MVRRGRSSYKNPGRRRRRAAAGGGRRVRAKTDDGGRAPENGVAKRRVGPRLRNGETGGESQTCRPGAGRGRRENALRAVAPIRSPPWALLTLLVLGFAVRRCYHACGRRQTKHRGRIAVRGSRAGVESHATAPHETCPRMFSAPAFRSLSVPLRRPAVPRDKTTRRTLRPSWCGTFGRTHRGGVRWASVPLPDRYPYGPGIMRWWSSTTAIVESPYTYRANGPAE